MRYVRLVAVCDEYDCEPGLVVKGTPMFEGMMADRGGEMIAHDLLEHQNGVKAIGPLDDELEALGGIWQVRGRHYDMCRDGRDYHSPQAHIASDIINMFRDIDGSYWLPSIGQYRTHRCDYDEDFQDIIEEARKGIRAEYTDMGRGDPDEDEQGWTADLFNIRDAYLDNALHLMRRGFRKAQRRFGDGYVGINQFKAIKQAVKLHRPEFEGQEFRLAYGNGEARVDEIYEEDY